MSSENRNSTKISKASTYLSGEENELVFKLIGRRCQSICTTVAQLYQTESPEHHRWVKKHTGALCFVKDNAKRSYFCRMFCLVRHEMVWEQEMYDTIEITPVRNYLLSFEGQDGMIALNFAFEDEAEHFLQVAIATVASRNRRREERKTRMRKEPPARPPPITNVNQSNNKPLLTEEAVTLRNPTNITKLAPPPQPAYVPQQSSISSSASKGKKRDGKPRLTKADIGTPSNFKHVTHVGWNAKSGFDLSGEDEALKPFLQKAGVSENQLKDRRTRDFIYDFIQTNNVQEMVRKETRKPAPPVPTRQQNQNGEKSHTRLAPPPPPPSAPPAPPQRDYYQQQQQQQQQKQAPALPTTSPSVRSTPPRPPQAPSVTVAAPPPPPPPPPPMSLPVQMPSPAAPPTSSSLPVVPDTRNALMDSIRKGAQLKKVDVSSTTSNNSGDTRSDLLSEIRGGIELRPVSDRPTQNRSSDGTGVGTDALADALRRALEQRKMAVNGASSSESENENSDDGEWSD